MQQIVHLSTGNPLRAQDTWDPASSPCHRQQIAHLRTGTPIRAEEDTGDKSHIVALGPHFKPKTPATNRTSYSTGDPPLLRLSWARSTQCQDVRFVAGVLGSKCGPGAKMYDVLPVSWTRSGVPVLRCMIRLPVSRARSGVPVLR